MRSCRLSGRVGSDRLTSPHPRLRCVFFVFLKQMKGNSVVVLGAYFGLKDNPSTAAQHLPTAHLHIPPTGFGQKDCKAAAPIR
jgi:hypothetical protein